MIKSLGGIFDLKLKETYSPQLKIYDPATNQWINDNPWIKDIHLETDAINYFRYYTLTPDLAGSYALQTDVIHNEQLYKTLLADILVGNSSATFSDYIIEKLKALQVSSGIARKYAKR